MIQICATSAFLWRLNNIRTRWQNKGEEDALSQYMLSQMEKEDEEWPEGKTVVVEILLQWQGVTIYNTLDTFVETNCNATLLFIILQGCRW